MFKFPSILSMFGKPPPNPRNKFTKVNITGGGIEVDFDINNNGVRYHRCIGVTLRDNGESILLAGNPTLYMGSLEYTGEKIAFVHACNDGGINVTISSEKDIVVSAWIPHKKSVSGNGLTTIEIVSEEK